MSFYDDASWLLIPSGIEEDIVFAQKPISGLGDLSFTRASDATYTDSTGVVRRSPYNLLQYSEDFSNVAWTKTNAGTGVLPLVTANQGTAPNGTLTADRVQLNRGAGGTVSDSSVVRQQVTVKNNEITTISIYLKSFDGNNYQIVFSNSGVAVSQKITVTSEWQRFFLTGVSATTVANIEIQLREGVFGITGQSVSADLLVWGAQLVEGTSALDYFPTTNRQDVPRIDFRNADGTLSSCGRLLLEPQRTNSIRNSSMVGAVAPSTFPTNWGTGGSAGLTRTIVGTGTENGLPYIDIRYNGTTIGSLILIDLESAGGISATNGQTWTNSFYAKFVSGTPLQIQPYMAEFNSSNTFLTIGYGTSQLATTSLRRYSLTRANNQATCASVIAGLSVVINNATAYDFTIRIAAPQMELGAYATTWVPTTTAAVTRLADAASKTGVSSLIGQTEGTLYFEFTGPSQTNVYYTLSASVLSNTIAVGINPSGQINARIFASFPTVAINVGTFGYIAGQKYKVAFAYNSTQCAIAVNGVLQTTSGFAGFPANTLVRFGIDNSNAGTQVLLGTHDQAALFPTRLTNAQLAQLTTL